MVDTFIPENLDGDDKRALTGTGNSQDVQNQLRDISNQKPEEMADQTIAFLFGGTSYLQSQAFEHFDGTTPIPNEITSIMELLVGAFEQIRAVLKENPDAVERALGDQQDSAVAKVFDNERQVQAAKNEAAPAAPATPAGPSSMPTVDKPVVSPAPDPRAGYVRGGGPMPTQESGDSTTAGAAQGAAETTEISDGFELPVQEGLIAMPYGPGRGFVGIKVNEGQSISAVADGTVTNITKHSDDNTIVTVQHGDNLLGVYQNLEKVNVARGQTIKMGDELGVMGAGDPVIFGFQMRNRFGLLDPNDYIDFSTLPETGIGGFGVPQEPQTTQPQASGLVGPDAQRQGSISSVTPGLSQNPFDTQKADPSATGTAPQGGTAPTAPAPAEPAPVAPEDNGEPSDPGPAAPTPNPHPDPADIAPEDDGQPSEPAPAEPAPEITPPTEQDVAPIHDWQELLDGEGGQQTEHKNAADQNYSDKMLLQDVINYVREQTGDPEAFKALEDKLNEGDTFVQTQDSIIVTNMVALGLATASSDGTPPTNAEYVAIVQGALQHLEDTPDAVVVDELGIQDTKSLDGLDKDTTQSDLANSMTMSGASTRP